MMRLILLVHITYYITSFYKFSQKKKNLSIKTSIQKKKKKPILSHPFFFQAREELKLHKYCICKRQLKLNLPNETDLAHRLFFPCLRLFWGP